MIQKYSKVIEIDENDTSKRQYPGTICKASIPAADDVKVVREECYWIFNREIDGKNKCITKG